MIPFGTYTNAMRTGVAAAVFLAAFRAGIMESSSGRASAVPNPRNMVRRDRCFPVM